MFEIKGWQFTKTHEPLEMVEKDTPKAEKDHVVIKTGAVGLCHSDVGTMEDEGWMALMNAPVIMGHENAGTIIEVGRCDGLQGRRPRGHMPDRTFRTGARLRL